MFNCSSSTLVQRKVGIFVARNMTNYFFLQPTKIAKMFFFVSTLLLLLSDRQVLLQKISRRALHLAVH